MTIKVPCKNCGQQTPVDDFKLHYKYKMMVCPACYSGRTEEIRKREEKVAAKDVKPPDWDKEDEILERMTAIRKQENQAQFSKIAGTDQVKCNCANCKYSFKYNPYRKQPRTCPYCNADVPKLRTYNLL